ncbi:hypothetical protein [Halodesulfovibrio spirochaetisodalis]|uniref:DUF3303 domain-containing protein n=1 Tax=Halodesulfovibrio spirochaetisodalis TaxID=1560234 RepID=A0A1B7XDI7_9BACT|nr:hypothetical protein [Halodesulfovibrio spirochaetisodalis]OBQ52108.1 hypothetical protein SP90_07955 [Halodesulfovibrio spirochaetisodalis]
MTMYICHFTCNPAMWPVEHEDQIRVWRSMVKDADMLVEGEGPVKFTGWISNTEGYALLEAKSKNEVIQLCARFWPYFYNDIREIVPTHEAGDAILAGAKEGWE